MVQCGGAVWWCSVVVQCVVQCVVVQCAAGSWCVCVVVRVVQRLV